MAQGLGLAIMEETPVAVTLIEQPEPGAPFGAKGCDRHPGGDLHRQQTRGRRSYQGGRHAAIAVDNWAVDLVPFEADAPRIFPFHQIAIPGLGMTLGEFWWLDDLATACREDGKFEFFMAPQPLNVTNGSGSMLNPLVIK